MVGSTVDRLSRCRPGRFRSKHGRAEGCGELLQADAMIECPERHSPAASGAAHRLCGAAGSADVDRVDLDAQWGVGAVGAADCLGGGEGASEGGAGFAVHAQQDAFDLGG